jgi:hypothetical protein
MWEWGADTCLKILGHLASKSNQGFHHYTIIKAWLDIIEESD